MYRHRDLNVDILRALGILCIIFAHISPPPLLAQIRNFDVPLMATLAGVSFVLTSSRYTSYKNYIWKRFKRLVLPAWIFLCLFFTIMAILGVSFKTKDYLFSYLLMTVGRPGIGYMWIIGIFFVISMVMPFLMELCRKLSTVQWYVFLGVILVFWELLCSTLPKMSTVPAFLTYSSGYVICAAMGLKLEKLSSSAKGMAATVLWILFVILLFQNDFAPTQTAKYPPRIYYLSYAFASILTLMTFLERYKPSLWADCFRWLSQNSMSLYLWHLLPLKICQMFPWWKHGSHWTLRFATIFILTLLCTTIWNRVYSVIKR